MTDPNEKINKFLAVMEEGSVSKEDFIDFAKVIVNALKDMRASFEKDVISFKESINSTVGSHNKTIRSVESTVDNLWKNTEVRNEDLAKEISSSISRDINKVKDTIPKSIDVNALESRIENNLEGAMKSSFLEFKNIIQEKLEARQIRDSLESLEGDDRLDKSAIKGLEEELIKIRKINGGNQLFYGPGGKGKIRPFDVSSQLNGVLKTFDLPANWTVVSVASTSSPAAFRPIIDYTFNQSSITFTSEINAATTLKSGQTLIVVIEEL